MIAAEVTTIRQKCAILGADPGTAPLTALECSMTLSKTANAAATLALASVAVLGTGTAALAQTATDPCYPTCSAGVSDSTVTPGQTVVFNSGAGSFQSGTSVEVRVLGDTFTRQATANGNVSLTYTVPTDTRPGRYEAVFGDRVRVPFTVVSAAAASPGRGQLPRTGSEDLVALALGGSALVAAGAGMIVVARRRRELTPGSLA